MTVFILVPTESIAVLMPLANGVMPAVMPSTTREMTAAYSTRSCPFSSLRVFHKVWLITYISKKLFCICFSFDFLIGTSRRMPHFFFRDRADFRLPTDQ